MAVTQLVAELGDLRDGLARSAGYDVGKKIKGCNRTSPPTPWVDGGYAGRLVIWANKVLSLPLRW
jgi:hypothetical protein